ncbi:hypothetical protein M758_5G172100 [Ceratodon purpureus]|nr:hypothetical protein M758_5G172100 [Ceratodon purpureus]
MVAFASVIGTIELPPKWALGYHQCRWSYETAEKVSKIAQTFREKKMPCDVIWMDIDYMQAFKCFTFDKDAFPDAKALSNQLHSIGFKGIWMLDPGIKVEDNYEVYESGNEADVWVQSQSGKPYIGECWPGPVVFPDFTNKKVRKWWSKLVKKFVVANGVDGIWNDMNEPAVFKTVSKTMPETNIHRGDEEIGGVQLHTYYHNGLSGQPFSGPDIGGFAGEATPKMFARWMGIGSMLPFSRGHSEKETIDQEPWAFGSQVEELCRFALSRRYRLLPHFYTLFYQAHKRGVPVMTPLFFADPSDPSLRTRDDGFLLGSILVSACHTPKHPKNSLEAFLPKGIWQRFHFEDDSPELPLLFLKGGGIVPTGPVLQHTGEAKPTDTVTLLIALDDKGKAEGVLYEDDGDGFGYKHDKYLLTYYEAQQLPRPSKNDAAEVVIKVARFEGQWPRPNRKLHIRLLLGNTAQVEGECKDGEQLKIKLPTPAQIDELVAKKHKFEIAERERTQTFLDEVLKERSSMKGVGGVLCPIDLQAGNVTLKVVPWIGGRIVSMIHMPSGNEWLEGRFESGCYEEYSGHEFRSAGCTEEYQVVKHLLDSMDGQEFLGLEGDIGGGLIMSRDILIAKDSPDKVKITSRIEARSVGAGSGGTSRLVRLRVHPLMKLVHPLASVIKYTSIDGAEYVHHANMEFGEISIEGTDRPKGQWRLEDTETGIALINRFDVNQVTMCLISWGPGSVTLELWSEERPVSTATPIVISHEYEFVDPVNKA